MIGQDNISGKEKFISQCIICGLLLAFLLFVRSINIPIAIQLRSDIKEVLAVGSTTDNFTELSESIIDSIESFRDRILGSDDNIDDIYMPDNTANEISFPAITPYAPGLEYANIGDDSMDTAEEPISHDSEVFHIDYSSGVRIDEDILSDINSHERFLIH